MARGMVYREGIGAGSFPCINGTSETLRKGRPLMAKRTAGFEGAVMYAQNGVGLGEFAGVLSEHLDYNGMADVSSSKLKRWGKMRANVYVHANPANYVVGCNLCIKYSTTNGAYFEQTSRNTGIRLLDNFTGKTASTLYSVETGAGGTIFVDPGVGWYGDTARYLYPAALAADADYFLNDQATSAVTTTTVLAAAMLNSATPDYARNVVITPGGTTTDVPAGDVMVYGVDIHGAAISEAFTFAANASAAVTGNKAFARLTSVVFPIQDTTGAATYDVGFGDKLGLGRCFPSAPVVLQTRLNGTIEGTAPTVAVDVDDVSGNTVDLSSALNGNDVEVILLVA